MSNKTILSRVKDALNQDAPDKRLAAPPSGLRRFLSDNPMPYQEAKEAAETYVENMGADGERWLFLKPYDRTPGHTEFFRLMYDVLGLLQLMKLPFRGRILEVGSGPGWVTEILILLGYQVDSLEPSADMVRIAEQRVASARQHFRLDADPIVTFHTKTMEDADFAAETFDAVLFFDALHHCVDEYVVFAKSFAALKPGGCIGIVESAWHPDFKNLEAQAIEEMRKFGTLENFFSTDYLDLCLENAGFIDGRRFAAVNGFFTASQLAQKMENFGHCPIIGSNNVVAYKPSIGNRRYPNVADPTAKSSILLSLQEGGIDGKSHRAQMRVALTNDGDTLLVDDNASSGHVTLALRRGRPGAADFAECSGRFPLPTKLPPGESVEMTLSFTLPPDAPLDGWELDGVAELLFWFSDRTGKSLPIPVL